MEEAWPLRKIERTTETRLCMEMERVNVKVEWRRRGHRMPKRHLDRSGAWYLQVHTSGRSMP